MVAATKPQAFGAVLILLAALAFSPAQASRYEAVSSPQCKTITTGGWKQLIRSGEGNNLGLGALIGANGQPLSYYINVGYLKHFYDNDGWEEAYSCFIRLPKFCTLSTSTSLHRGFENSSLIPQTPHFSHRLICPTPTTPTLPLSSLWVASSTL